MRRVALTVGIAAATAAAGATSAWAIGITYSCGPHGRADCDGWHTKPVTIAWIPLDGGTLQCTSPQVIDTDGRNDVRCTASDANGDVASATAHVAIDQTLPVVTGATASRLPDHNGWYRAPLQVTFAGNDPSPGSGLVGCTSVTYAGPGGDPASVMGTCTDIAGNASAPFAFPIRFDATPPAVAAPTATTGDRVVRLRWRAPPDAVSVSITRRPGRGGAASSVVHRGAGEELVDRHVGNGRRYRYTVLAVDAAGNAASATSSAVPDRRLLGPVAGVAVAGPPTLRWTAVRRARYYNVQLFRRGHKLLSAWPRRAHFKLRAHWRYGGRRHRLTAGRYRWYVWPGRGRPSQQRFGALIGSAEFVVRAGA